MRFVSPEATFSEDIALTGTGSIVLRNLSGGSDVPITLPDDVWIAGAVLTINPASTLVDGDEYAVEISNDALEDFVGNDYGGLTTGEPNWSFTVNTPAAQLVRHYAFENAGDLGEDSASGSNNATVTGTVTQTTGPPDWGQAGDFSAGAGYLLQSPASAAPDSRMGSNAGALAVWFKTTDDTSARQSLVFGGNSEQNIFLIDMVAGGVVDVFIRDSGGSVIDFQHTTANLADGKWHHAALTWDGEDTAPIPGTHTLRLYIDGTEELSEAGAGVNWVGVGNWSIGGRSGSVPFNGSLDEVRIYAGGEVLSAGEVATLAASSGGYDDWADTNAGGQTPELDYNANGVPNGIEYFMGGTLASPATMPALVEDGSTWSWTILYDTDAEVTWKFQVSEDLVNWTDYDEDDVGDEVQILTSPDRIKLTLPASATGKTFVRLVVVTS